MKKLKKLIRFLIIFLVIILLLFGFVKITGIVRDKVMEYNLSNIEWIRKNVNISKDNTLGTDIYSVSKNNKISIYNSKYISIISEKLDDLINNNYTTSSPLIIYNLYGTNEASINVYFNSSEDINLSYTVSVDDKNINDFSRTLSTLDSNKEDNLYKYQLIGLVIGYKNSVKLEYKNSDGEVIDTKTIDIDLSNIKNMSEVVLDSEDGDSTEDLSNGLYSILGNDSDNQDYLFLYDNNGVLRSQMPIIGYRAHRILFKDNKMYYSISQTKIVCINNLGEVEHIYKTGNYYLHHDYTFDDDGNILVLANNRNKSTEEDTIIKINLETSEVSEVLDFEKIFASYVVTCTLDTISVRDEGEDGLDWLHLNSIEYVDGDVIVSSRETSSIMKISNIETDPKLEYILADETLWSDTDFSSYVYEKIGDFKIHAGQHSVRYSTSDTDGVYYLTFFDNNYGKSNSQPDFNYSDIGISNNNAFTGDESYYYVYKVDEVNKTFELVDSMSVAYSGIVSSVQTLANDNILIDSGTKGIFSEYDSNHNLIRKFTTKLNKYMVYRVLKYDFNDFWFSE